MAQTLLQNQLQQPYVASDEEKNAIQILVKNIVSAINAHEGSFDRTIKSVVTSVKDNTYIILDETGISRVVKCAIPNVTIKAGTSVWVTIPCGRLNEMFISGVR